MRYITSLLEKQYITLFVTHNIKPEVKKKAVLLSECGAATYKLIRSLVVPQKPSEVEYKVLLA